MALLRPARICIRLLSPLERRAVPSISYLNKKSLPWNSFKHLHFYRGTRLSAAHHKVGGALKARALLRRNEAQLMKERSSEDEEEEEDDDEEEEEEEEEEVVKKPRKSKNQLKREAALSFQWAKDIAEFTPRQIKRIARVASLEENFIQAVFLVKRLGPDVREGKRRQFSYIGRLLRKAKPELIDALIEATRDGNVEKIRELSLKEKEDNDYFWLEEDEYDVDAEAIPICFETSKRWTEGLISEDESIKEEVYNSSVGFNRQELRKLIQNAKKEVELEENKAQQGTTWKAQYSLRSFLFNLAKKRSDEEYWVLTDLY